MLREADTNNDGQISKEEFVELLEEATLPDSLSQYDSRLGHDAIAHKAIHSIDD
jgi:calcium-dependent protein kinase